MQIESYDGKSKETGCLGCAPRESIIRANRFVAYQDFEIPIPGFIIVSSIRHFMSIDEMADDELLEFPRVLKFVREGMRYALDVDEAYLFQNEDSAHHFHMWMFPRYDWMERFGRKIQSVRPIMEYARKELKTPQNIEEVKRSINVLKGYLASS